MPAEATAGRNFPKPFNGWVLVLHLGLTFAPWSRVRRSGRLSPFEDSQTRNSEFGIATTPPSLRVVASDFDVACPSMRFPRGCQARRLAASRDARHLR